jgi:DNA-binding NarL/FixJ family response regulator
MLALTQFTLGEWDAAAATARTDAMTPAAAAAALRAVDFSVRGGRGDTAVAEEFELSRKWWDLDVMLPILGMQPAVDAYRQLDQPAEAEKLIADVSALCADIFQSEWFLARIRFSTLGLQLLCHRAVGEPSAAAELVARGAELLAVGHATAEKGLPPGRLMGVEGLAWLARLESEWERLRWLAGVDAPTPEEHVAAWERTVDAFGYGYVFEQAWSRVRLSAALRAAGRVAEANEQATLAAEVGRELGAKPLLDEIGGVDTGGASALTSRETEVLALLAEGRTNRQLARELYISEKTVSVHVSNLLRKTETGSRREVAALARRVGWVTNG